MSQVTKVKNEISLLNWQRLIDDKNQSGLSVRKWCELHEVSTHAYYYWLRKIREKAIDQLPAEIRDSLKISGENERPPAFRRLEVESPAPGYQADVTVHLPNATLEVSNGAEQSTVEAVLLALRAVC